MAARLLVVKAEVYNDARSTCGEEAAALLAAQRPDGRARSIRRPAMMHQDGQRQESRHRLEWMAAALRRAAKAAGVQLTMGYSRRVATDGLASAEQLGVTRLGNGVVIHTASELPDRPPVVVGYADRSGQWCADGRRFIEADSTPGSPSSPIASLGL